MLLKENRYLHILKIKSLIYVTPRNQLSRRKSQNVGTGMGQILFLEW